MRTYLLAALKIPALAWVLFAGAAALLFLSKTGAGSGLLKILGRLWTDVIVPFFHRDTKPTPTPSPVPVIPGLPAVDNDDLQAFAYLRWLAGHFKGKGNTNAVDHINAAGREIFPASSPATA